MEPLRRENARAPRIVHEISSFSARFLHSGPPVRFIRRASMEVKSPNYYLLRFIWRSCSPVETVCMHPVDLPSFLSIPRFPYVTTMSYLARTIDKYQMHPRENRKMVNLSMFTSLSKIYILTKRNIEHLNNFSSCILIFFSMKLHYFS